VIYRFAIAERFERKTINQATNAKREQNIPIATSRRVTTNV
jgi:hypothetical protein